MRAAAVVETIIIETFGKLTCIGRALYLWLFERGTSTSRTVARLLFNATLADKGITYCVKA
jgi:hypothetical protein